MKGQQDVAVCLVDTTATVATALLALLSLNEVGPE